MLLGIATMRAGVFPRWAGILLLAQGILNFVVDPLPPSTMVNFIQLAPYVAFTLSLVWCGYTLMDQRKEPVAGAAPSLAASAAHLR